ncbi:molybdopterin-guanine dinucleotide biosynthesis protein MobC [Pectobacterium aroidearum]|uniref:molybdopterin-guanine dinucleotide biosynthesis protein MobC n=1 Tax=Pectobacterium aroidearum TaxID=1201031 RepID=UPI0031596383
MVRKNFFSDDDIEKAKKILAESPDLTPKRKTRQDFLDAIREDLVSLIRTKGYTLGDIKETLKSAGYEVSDRALRDVMQDADKKKQPRKIRSKKSSDQEKLGQ